jgi:hypothetical protein
LGEDGSETSYTAKLVPTTYNQRFTTGTTILTNDRQIYISSVGLAAMVSQVGDIVAAGGLDYHIIDADPNNYDSATSVVFICKGRQ